MQTMDMSIATLVKQGKISQQLAFERCHDPEELQRLIGSASPVSAGQLQRRLRQRSLRVLRRQLVRRELRVPATYTYKARDKAGKVITGSLMADNEGLVLNRLREMGHTPLEVGKQKKSMNLEINLHPGG